MTDPETIPAEPTKSSPFATAINVLVAPGEAFASLERAPTRLFPLATIVLSTVLVMVWYFSIIDFDWYIDDSLSGRGNLSEEQRESAREAMQSISQGRFMFFGVLGSSLGVIVMYVLQSGYLSMMSALNGDRFRFGHWLSLVCWCNIPSLLAVIGMAVTIAMSPNGQISAFDLNPLTLANLGITTANAGMRTMLTTISLTMLWSMTLIVLGYRQWLQASWIKSLGVVLAPYVLIFGISTYFALT